MIAMQARACDLDFVAQVREELREYAAGVTGVPHFIINGKYHLSGAQDPEYLAEVLAKA